MGKIDGVSAIALILLASFAIDRVVTATLFLASYFGILPNPALAGGGRQQVSAENNYKLAYFIMAGLLAIVAALVGNIRILNAMGVPQANDVIDILLTGIVLVGGADRIASVLKETGVPGSEQPQSKPIEITGNITVIDPRNVAGQAR